ncbi:hypothetical protein COY07_00015 [Candidatus Peregrinibacteria bacterium CG_4_10_14_0_2_um_filter_43_11]|nr:MAG: hypothetical protein COY07_00015 [Candidatus Peregrinibacteria bacterium CG_4_10_14_0_2_um_filter_43_11]
MPSNHLESLHDAWVVNPSGPGGYYWEAQGDLSVNGQKYVWFTKLHDGFGLQKDSFVTNRRALRSITADPNKKPDLSVVDFWGWSETTAGADGVFMEVLLEALQEVGATNPQILGLNVAGKGTPEYLNSKTGLPHINRVSWSDKMEDASAIVTRLLESHRLSSRIVLMGHSMAGTYDIHVLHTIRQYAQSKHTRHEVKHVIQLAPASDLPRAFWNPSFFGAVQKPLMRSLHQPVATACGRSSGNLGLTSPEHHDIMMHGSFDSEAFKRTVPDSAREFHVITLHQRRKLAAMLEEDHCAEGIPFSFFRGVHDRLMTRGLIDQLSVYMQSKKVGADVRQVVQSDHFGHAFPFTSMTPEQKGDLKEFLKLALVCAVRGDKY